jgi:glycosyltransferase involved in cell wall biosynthesis
VPLLLNPDAYRAGYRQPEKWGGKSRLPGSTTISFGMNRTRSIAVNGRFLSQPITGVQRYAHELLSALDRLLSAGEVEFVPVTVFTTHGTKALPQWSALNVRPIGRFSGQLWEQIDLAFHARGQLLFTPCGGAPIAQRDHVLTIHDAGTFSTPGSYTRLYRTYYNFLETILARSARHLVTISQFSRHELSRHLRVSEEKISVAPSAAEHVLRFGEDPSVLSRHGLRSGGYVLSVASGNPNKNLRGLIDAARFFESAGLCLAIAGGTNSAIFSDGAPPGRTVKKLGFVNDSELRTLYENAACFVLPSFYEGFGMPPLEALTLGCPVVVSRAASLPEVFGSAATYCDPYSSEDIARQVIRVAGGDHPSREDAAKHASTFTFEKSARIVWSILLDALH